jgi:hypothetical protein
MITLVKSIHEDEHLSDAFPIQNDLKQGDISIPLLLNTL